MSCKFVSIQGTYNKIELALFNESLCVDFVSQADVKASSHLIPLLDSLLQKNNLNFTDLSFMAVDKGPGAFTSLRVTIATVNGLAFAQQLPLIGISGLEALAHQVFSLIPEVKDKPDMVVCLLNAYNNDVYYLCAPRGESSLMGYKKIDDIVADLNTKADSYQIWLAGNGVEVHREFIQDNLAGRVKLIDPFIGICSAINIGQLAYAQWLAGQGVVKQITPQYLKTQLFAIKK